LYKGTSGFSKAKRKTGGFCMKKILAVLMAAAMIAAATTGCGSSSSSSAATSGAASGAASTASAKDVYIGSCIYKFDDTFMTGVRNAMTLTRKEKVQT
jgi:methyl-galactoside transport system substrate-binding protein